MNTFDALEAVIFLWFVSGRSRRSGLMCCRYSVSRYSHQSAKTHYYTRHRQCCPHTFLQNTLGTLLSGHQVGLHRLADYLSLRRFVLLVLPAVDEIYSTENANLTSSFPLLRAGAAVCLLSV